MDVKFPFPVASDNEQLEDDIIEFNLEEYNDKLNKLHKQVGLVFNGNASCKLAEKICNEIDNKLKK